MTSVYRTFALVAGAFVIAALSFVDRIALALGNVGLVAAAVVCVLLSIAAALSIGSRGRHPEPAHGEDGVDVVPDETTHPSSI